MAIVPPFSLAQRTAGDGRRAARLLAGHHGITRTSVHAAAAAADADALSALLTAAPALARAEGGPYGWEPVLYLAYARHDPAITRAATVRAADTGLKGPGSERRACHSHCFSGLNTVSA